MKLLAPAGDMTAAKTAFAAGADECYIGGKMSARAYAKGFDENEIEEITAFAHMRGRSVHVALNTMIGERELDEAVRYAGVLYDIGVDAVIVADIGLALALSAAYPNLPLHASTQMGVSDRWGAAEVKRLGMKRVVAARETEFAELRRMAQTGIEVEAFCHGAMCSSVSGACLMSSFIGGRSGNRGRCAQPCRKLYDVFGRGYHLSMKDLCVIGRLFELAAAGVASLKIEGRMKRPEYVAVVTEQYRRAIDAVEEGRPVQADMEALKKIFNRGGFWQGFSFDNSMGATYTKNQSHMGVPIGRIEKKTGKSRAELRMKKGYRPLLTGDGIEVCGDKSRGGMTVDYVQKGEISVPAGAKAGDTVYLTTDSVQLREAWKLVDADMRIPGSLFLYLAEGKPAQAIAEAGGVRTAVSGETAQHARKAADTARIVERMKKTGGTNIAVEHVSVELEGEPFLSAAQLNDLRRRAVEALEQALTEAHRPYEPVRGEAPVRKKPTAPKKRYVAAQVVTADQCAAALDGGADRIYMRAEDTFGRETDAMLDMETDAEKYLVLPPFWRAADAEEFQRRIGGLMARGLQGVVEGTLGQLALCRRMGIPAVADLWENVANTLSASYFDGGYTASAELSAGACSDIGGEVVVYGRLPMMNLVHCPLRSAGHCGSCGGDAMTDEAGRSYGMYRFRMGKNCLLQVTNPVTTAYNRVERLRTAAGIRLMFFGEDAKTVRNVTKSYGTALESGAPAILDGIIAEETNSGQLRRGVTDG